MCVCVGGGGGGGRRRKEREDGRLATVLQIHVQHVKSHNDVLQY